MMTSLPLNPLPSVRVDDAAGSFQIERDGFVDDAVVMALLAAPVAARVSARPQDLALSSNDEDFAGWQVTAPAPPRMVTEPAPKAPSSPVRRATPPNVRSHSTIVSHRSSAGWWLAGLSGIFTSLLISAVLLTWGNPPMEPPTASDFEAGRIMEVPVPMENSPSVALATDLTEAVSPQR